MKQQQCEQQAIRLLHIYWFQLGLPPNTTTTASASCAPHNYLCCCCPENGGVVGTGSFFLKYFEATFKYILFLKVITAIIIRL